jgi:hypothetical protein
VRHVYTWLERKFHSLYNELWNFSLSALSEELLKKKLAHMPFYPGGGDFLTPSISKTA